MIVHGIINDDTRGISNYPFTDTANLTSDDNVYMPQDIFIDASIYIRSSEYRVYISSVENRSGTIVITIKDFSGEELTVIAESSFASYDNQFGFYRVTDAFNDDRGSIGFNPHKLLGIMGQKSILSFSYRSTQITPSALVPVQPVQGVTNAFTVGDRRLSGDVWFVGGPGIVLKDTGNEFSVNATGERLYRRANTINGEECYETRRPLQGLNLINTETANTTQVRPDDTGNIFITPVTPNSSFINFGSEEPELTIQNPIRITQEEGKVDISIAGPADELFNRNVNSGS